MDRYAVTDGVHRYEFERATFRAACAQARGVLLMDQQLDSDRAELQFFRGDTWRPLGFVRETPRQAPYSVPKDIAVLS